MTYKPLLPLLFVVALIAAACGSDSSTTAAGEGSPAIDGEWLLIDAVIDGAPLQPLDDFPLTLMIDGDRIGGSAGCNSFGGTFTLDGTALELIDVGITEMACLADGAMEVESTFINGFWRATSLELIGGDLVIGGEGVSLTYGPVAPVPDSPLVDTDWTLDTIIDGEAASSTVAGAAPVTLALDGDGRFAASTGCRSLEGTYELDGDVLTLEVDVGDAECDGPDGQQEPQILAVLEQPELQVEIIENRLTLQSSAGTGLSFRTG